MRVCNEMDLWFFISLLLALSAPVSVSLNFYGRTGILRPRVVYARTLFLPVSPISVRAVPGTEFSAVPGLPTLVIAHAVT